jgi:DNA mismatch repair ATPase MutS
MTNEIEDLAHEKISLPKFHEDMKTGYDLEKIMEELNKNGQVSDYNDMESIHTQMNAARLSLYHIIQAQKDAYREQIIAEQKYKRLWARVYVGSTGTERIKTTIADIKTEKYQDDFIVAQERSRELQHRAQFLRDELKVLESLSNDYRQIIRSQQ